jgi:hypothetical protein
VKEGSDEEQRKEGHAAAPPRKNKRLKRAEARKKKIRK